MPEYRASAQDLSRSDTMSFGQHWEVRTTYPLKQCLNNRFLLSVRDFFQAGDLVNLVRYVNDKWKEVIEEVPHIRIASVDAEGVELMQVFDIIVKTGKNGEKDIIVDRGLSGQFIIRVDGAVRSSHNSWQDANEAAQMLADDLMKPATLFHPKKPPEVYHPQPPQAEAA